jgi:hypothetical protein
MKVELDKVRREKQAASGLISSLQRDLHSKVRDRRRRSPFIDVPFVFQGIQFGQDQPRSRRTQIRQSRQRHAIANIAKQGRATGDVQNSGLSMLSLFSSIVRCASSTVEEHVNVRVVSVSLSVFPRLYPLSVRRCL